MRIAIDISQIVHEGTGVATYTDQLVRNLLKIDQQNEYLLFGISFRKFNKLSDYFAELKKLNNNLFQHFFHIPSRIGEFLWNRLHLVNIDNLLDDIDIFHSSDWIQPPTAAKKITTVHDLTVYKYPQFSHPFIVDTQKRRLKWVQRECDKILADSLATKWELINNLNIEEKRVEVVYPGISEKFKPVTEDEIIRVKQKYGLYDDYILSVGISEPRKNIKAAVDAFDRFLKHPLITTMKKPIQLVNVGKFGWGEKMENTKYVKNLGFVEENDLPALYSGASLFVYPSLYEGFGFPILEAMACGCPVICSGEGSLKELAADAALIADPDFVEDITMKMTQLFVNHQLRAELVAKGKKNVERFNWQKTASEVLAIYNKMTNRNL